MFIRPDDNNKVVDVHCVNFPSKNPFAVTI